MMQLKDKNMNQCFSLLREFIEATPAPGHKKGIAVTALAHLQKITAGTGNDGTGETIIPAGPDPGCIDVPRIDGMPLG